MHAVEAPRERRIETAAYAVAVVLLIAQSWMQLAAHPAEVFWDQQVFLEQRLHGVPEFRYGIVSAGLMGIANLAVPETAHVADWLVRGAAMTFFLASVALLVRAVTGGGRLAWLGLGLAYASRYPFLWLSTELIAAGFFALALWALLEPARRRLGFATLLLFGMSKPDIIFAATLGALACAWLTTREATSSERKRLLGMTAALFVGVPLVLSLLAPPGDPARRARSYASLSEHYSALVFPHQLAGKDAPHPWIHAKDYMRALWASEPGDSVPALVLRDPGRYVDFVFLSLARSVRKVWEANVGFLLLLAFAGRALLRRSVPGVTAAVILAASMVPITALAYLKVRYCARFYVGALLLVLLLIPALEGRKRWLGEGSLVALLGWQIFQLLPVYERAYWFPD